MLVFLVNNKKGRSEALCLRISGDRAVFAKGLYSPHESRFIPDDPKILNTNWICTSGEEKIELGNKLFNLFDVMYKDEEQTTLNEYILDNQDEDLEDDGPDTQNEDDSSDVEMTNEIILSALSMIMTYKNEADEIKSLIEVETDLEKEVNLKSALVNLSEQAYSVFKNIKQDLVFDQNNLPVDALSSSYDVFVSEVKQYAQNIYSNLQDDLKQIEDELFLVENEDAAIDLLEKKEPIENNISKVQNILMSLENVSSLTFVQKDHIEDQPDEVEADESNCDQSISETDESDVDGEPDPSTEISTVEPDQLIEKKMRFIQIVSQLNHPVYKSQTKELSQEMRSILNEIVPELKDNPGMHVDILKIADEVLDDAFVPGSTYINMLTRRGRVSDLIERFPFKESDSDRLEMLKEKFNALTSLLTEMKNQLDNPRV